MFVRGVGLLRELRTQARLKVACASHRRQGEGYRAKQKGVGKGGIMRHHATLFYSERPGVGRWRKGAEWTNRCASLSSESSDKNVSREDRSESSKEEIWGYPPPLRKITSFGAVPLAGTVFTIPILALLSWAGTGLIKAIVVGVFAFVSITVIVRGYLHNRLLEKKKVDFDDSTLQSPASMFREIKGVRVHLTQRNPSGEEGGGQNPPTPGGAAILFHGFGANTFSWEGCQQQLSTLVNAPVVAYDYPGFGLTERPRDVKAYSRKFLADIGSELIRDYDARVVIGHSLGGLLAVKAIQQESKISAVVLIAPAIFAYGQSMRKVPKVVSLSIIVAMEIWSAVLVTFIRVFRRVLYSILRRLVYSRRFWQAGLKTSYLNPEYVTQALISQYAKPRLVKGWEFGLVQFLRAQLAPRGFTSMFKEADENKDMLTKLRAIGVPVLIIHGRADRLVPLANSIALQKQLPNSKLVTFEAGHCPHEECPQEVVDCISEFLNSSFTVHTQK